MMIVGTMGLALASSTPTITQPTDPQNGKITVKNAAQGETYYAIKALSATVSADGIAYYGDIPTELQDVIEVATVNGYQVIQQKSGVTAEQYATALRNYANAKQSEWGTGIECTGNEVEFTNLANGFYVIVSTLVDGEQTNTTNKVSAGSTVNGGGVVYEKNEKTVTVTKEADDESYSIGDTITYTVTFNGINYVGSGADAKIVTKYEVKDTLPEFLKNAAVTKVQVGESDITSELDVSAFGTTKKFDIPWATKGTGAHDWTSKYPNSTNITITYTAVLTDTVNVNANNKNTVTITPYLDNPDKDEPEPYDEPWSADDEITTYAAALKKTDGTNALAGAKFAFKGLTAEKTADGIYTVTAYNSASTEYGTVMEVGTDGKLYVIGLKEDASLKGQETEAPAGYNLATEEVTMNAQVLEKEVFKASGTRYYDADGNLVKEESSSTNSKPVEKNLSELDTAAVTVVNKAGAELPSTGGIGTTIFYIAGLVLVLGAAAIVIARRKAEQ
jgi:fimbrial isopeptide formation D2 family protein/LPXTG-motif cell wall-anchored protein